MSGKDMASTPAERDVDWFRQQLGSVSDQTAAYARQLSTWLVVGNAGALVIASKAVLDGSVCVRQIAANCAWAFSYGLIFAFLGSISSYISNVVSLGFISRSLSLTHKIHVSEFYIDKLEAEGIEVKDDNPLWSDLNQAGEDHKALEKKIKILWVGPVVSIALFLVSACHFTVGITTSAKFSDLVSVKCSKAR